MSWALVASAALVFSGPVNAGLSACTPTGMAQAQLEQVSVTRQSQTLTEVPFTINTAEIVGGVEISASLDDGLFLSNGEASGTFELPRPLTPEEPLMLVTLWGADVSLIAFDVLIYGVKENLTFDATNAAKAHIFDVLGLFNLSAEGLVTAYSKIEEHPNFPSLVQFIRTHQGYPESETLLEAMAEIAIPIVVDLTEGLRNSQEPTDSLITPQTVRSGYGFPRTSTFTLTQPKDSNSVTVEASSMLEFRLMIFKKSVSVDASSLSALANL